LTYTSHPEEEPRQAPPRKLLIADDDPVVAWLHREIVEGPGDCVVSMASDGIECLEIARRERPDAILLDVNMPRMDGFQVLQELQADPDLHHIRVLFLTGDAFRVEDRLRGLSLGAYDYLVIPVEPEELLARVHVAFRLRDAEADAVAERERAAHLAGVLRAVRTLQHEINNPLQALMGSLDLLRLKLGPEAAKYQDQLHILDRATDRIANVTQRLGCVTSADMSPSEDGAVLRLPGD
jgi:DNA-binding response OmpR family regulator